MRNYIHKDGSEYPFPLAIFVFITILSIFSSWAANAMISWTVSVTLGVSGIMVFSFVVFFGLFYKAFDLHCWKWQFLHTLGFVSTPNLEGQWNSYVRSSLGRYPNPLDGNLRISQTYSELKITFKTKISRSSTRWAAITPEDDVTIELTYQFSAKRAVDNYDELSDEERYRADNWQDHDGTAQIVFHLDKGKGRPQSGTYYTNKDHGRRGDIHFGGETTESTPTEPEGTSPSKVQ